MPAPVPIAGRHPSGVVVKTTLDGSRPPWRASLRSR